jgi:replicative DNA helicase
MLWQAVAALYDAALPIDIVTVADELRAQGTFEVVGGGAALAGLIYDTPSAANIRAYTRPVSDAAAKREMIRDLDALKNKAYNPESDADVLTAELVRIAEQAERRRQPSVQLREYDDVLTDVLLDIAERREHQTFGTPTGFTDLDELINGLHPNRMYIVAARPGVGKSAFAENVAEHIGRNSGKTVLVFSLEMTAEQLAERDLAGEAKVNTRDLERGRLKPSEWNEVSAAAERMWGTKIVIEDGTDLNLSRMRAVARAAQAKYGQLGLIVVDYLQIVDTDDMKGMNRVQEVTELAKGFRKMSKERNCPLLALCQTSRECEKRDDKRGQLSDLRESGGIEAEAHTVMFLYRDADYRPVVEGFEVDNTTEIIIRKNRGGPKGTVKLAFIPEHARFRNLSKWGATSY